MVPGRRTAWAAVLALAAPVVAAVGVSTGTAPGGGTPGNPDSGGWTTDHPVASTPLVPITGFGGYDVFGAVGEVSADWVVPRIVGGPVSSYASTWIGVQARDGRFLQIGTTEDRWGGSTDYQAFWSDPDVGFEPQFLLVLRPGDEVSAQLTEGPDGWLGTLRDDTTGRLAAVPAGVHYGVGSDMNLAEWVQEDPEAGPGAPTDEPYPAMGRVTFTSLQVDGHQPDLTGDEATALASPNGVTLIPTPPRQDSFTFTVGTPAAGRYLRDIVAIDLVIDRFDAALGAGGTPSGGDGDALVAATTTLDHQLAGQPWPPGARRAIRRLVAHNEGLIVDLRAWQAAGGSRRALARFDRDGSDPAYANAVRAALGIPPVGLNRP